MAPANNLSKDKRQAMRCEVTMEIFEEIGNPSIGDAFDWEFYRRLERIRHKEEVDLWHPGERQLYERRFMVQ